MGCSTSKLVTDTQLKKSGGPIDIHSSNESVSLKIGDVSIRFAYMSKRGFYPNARDKENQDSVSVLPSFVV